MKKVFKEYQEYINAQNVAHYEYLKEMGWLHLYGAPEKVSFESFFRWAQGD